MSRSKQSPTIRVALRALCFPEANDTAELLRELGIRKDPDVSGRSGVVAKESHPNIEVADLGDFFDCIPQACGGADMQVQAGSGASEQAV